MIRHRGYSITNSKARSISPVGALFQLPTAGLLDEEDTLSFALPAVEPGALVEYEYTASYAEPISLPLSVPFLRDLPIRRVVSYPPSWQPHYFLCDNGAADLPPISSTPPAYLLLTTRSTRTPDDFWRAHAAQLAATFEQELSPVPPRPERSLTDLAEFCRTQIKNSLYRTDNLSPTDHAEPNATPADTLRRGIGWGLGQSPISTNAQRQLSNSHQNTC